MSQPATSFSDPDYPTVFKHNPKKPIWTYCCNTRRQARNLHVQIFHHSFRYFCNVGKGCRK